MKRLPNINKNGQIVWILCLLLPLLHAQGLPLHVHTYSHGAEIQGHVHYDHAHSVFELNQAPHADELAQLDFSDAGYRFSLNAFLVLALLWTGFIVLPFCGSCIRVPWQRQCRSLLLLHPPHISPPLRAPPRL